MFGATSQEKAYLAPFFGFLLIFVVGEAIGHFFDGAAFWMASSPRYWLFPLQTVVCGALLAHYWRLIEWRAPRHLLLASALGVAACALWVAPQEWFGFPTRTDGFNPEFFGASGWAYAMNLSFRFLRLVLVVPLVEEIFWRGFLLRYVIDEDFTRVPFGTFSWKSFGIVTAAFCLEHSPPDWPAALATGALYNLLACRTRNLAACVLAHAVTNLLLGIYVVHTRQWGFW
jgi:CAAX prenyl protease-like protein